MFKTHIFSWIGKLDSFYDRYYDDTTPVGEVGGKTDSEILDSLDDKEDKEGNKEGDIDDTLENLDEDEEDEDKDLDENDNEKNDKKEKKDKDEKDDADEEDGLDLDDADEETSIHQQLKTKYKGIYKAIPELRGVLFREQEFTRLYPTVDDAKEAHDMAETFVGFQKDIESGNPKTLLEATKELGSDALRNFSGNFLPALIELDKETYLNIISPEFKRMLRAAAQSPDENIRASAKNLNYFLWQNLDLDKDEGFVSGKRDEKEDKSSKRDKDFQDKQVNNFRNDAIFVAVKRAKKIIAKSIDGFDLSDLTKKHLVDEIFDRTTKSLKNDVRHNGSMDQLWKKAIAGGLNTEDKERIINAFLSRAKVSIPKHRQNVLTEAKISAKKAQDKEDKKVTRISGNNSSGKSGRSLGKINPADIDWNKTSERDLLDGKQPVMKSKQG